MKRFAFRLERILSYRRAMADLEHARLQRIENEVASRRANLERLNVDFAMEVARASPDSPSRAELGRYRRFVEAERIRLRTRIAEKEVELRQQREIYNRANQGAEVLNKVKLKQKKIWESELQKELDSLAMDSYLSRWKQ
ncbi:hypothetical protein [Bryobacter aggregatus]|uniref:hypothetical protein n=1 Tax=Bryobacter aggregatus TaxID=360054 RepID=UPI0004E14886|nr:hypothetical protein [Bryobacter aggregatus]